MFIVSWNFCLDDILKSLYDVVGVLVGDIVVSVEVMMVSDSGSRCSITIVVIDDMVMVVSMMIVLGVGCDSSNVVSCSVVNLLSVIVVMRCSMMVCDGMSGRLWVVL